MFDGVHRGHRHLLDALKHVGEQQGLKTAVVTFTGHPAATLRPGSQPPSLMSLNSRIALINELGIDEIIPLRFTKELASLTAAEFLAILKNKYGVDHLLLGFNTAMGCDRVSSPERFKEICTPLGIKVTQASEFVHPEAHRVSSTAIRRALDGGDVSLAAKLLGRPYRIEGIVEHGNAIGRQIGFPTANIKPEPSVAIPANGVYAALASFDNKTFTAVVNIGNRPTVGGKSPSIEAHLLDCNDNLYGKQLALDFIERLRNEQKFPSLNDLQKQIARDVSTARRIVK